MVSGRKEKLEQLAVLALLLVFGGVLTSALKGMGILGPKPPASVVSSAQAPGLNEGVSGIQKVDDAIQQAAAQARGHGATAQKADGKVDRLIPSIGYAANKLRDPMQPDFHLPGQGAPEQVALRSSGAANDSAEPAQRFPDNFMPARARLSTFPLDKIEGAIWGANKSQAIIGGRVYQVGDMFERGRIVAIDQEGITVELAGGSGQLGRRPGAAKPGGTGGMEGR